MRAKLRPSDEIPVYLRADQIAQLVQVAEQNMVLHPSGSEDIAKRFRDAVALYERKDVFEVRMTRSDAHVTLRALSTHAAVEKDDATVCTWVADRLMRLLGGR